MHDKKKAQISNNSLALKIGWQPLNVIQLEKIKLTT